MNKHRGSTFNPAEFGIDAVKVWQLSDADIEAIRAAKPPKRTK